MRKISIGLILVLFGAAGVACAEEQSGAAGAVQTQDAPAATSAAPAEKRPAAAGPAATEQKAGAAVTASRAEARSHADPAYRLKLAAAVRAHVPKNASIGAGTASCSFQVTANGATSGIACKGSSPAHSQLLQKAIAATKAPPPPGGSFSTNQSVVFH